MKSITTAIWVNSAQAIIILSMRRLGEDIPSKIKILNSNATIFLGICNLRARLLSQSGISSTTINDFFTSPYTTGFTFFFFFTLLMSLPSMLDYHIDGSVSLRELRIINEETIILLEERATI